MRKVEAHQTTVRRHDGLVDLEVGRATREALNINTPLLRVNVESSQSTTLAEKLDLVNVLVTAIVASTGVAFGVLVGHGRAQSIEDGARGDVLGGNKDNGLALALNLSRHDLSNLGVRVEKALLEHLSVVIISNHET